MFELEKKNYRSILIYIDKKKTKLGTRGKVSFGKNKMKEISEANCKLKDRKKFHIK